MIFSAAKPRAENFGLETCVPYSTILISTPNSKTMDSDRFHGVIQKTFERHVIYLYSTFYAICDTIIIGMV